MKKLVVYPLVLVLLFTSLPAPGATAEARVSAVSPDDAALVPVDSELADTFPLAFLQESPRPAEISALPAPRAGTPSTEIDAVTTFPLMLPDSQGTTGLDSTEGDWIDECVDCPHSFSTMTDRSLALDPNGHPHIAYGGDHLYYARHDGSAWHLETVDGAANVGGDTSLALDWSGYPHISYLDTSNGDLRYAYRDDAVWHVETVDSAGSVGWYTSLALDMGGYAHISYYDNSNDDLKYAYQDAAGWHLETVDSAGDVGLYTSLVLDAGGYPHISYYDGFYGDLEYAHRDEAGWHLETVDSTGDVGLYTSLALDGAGYPHISYYDDTNRDLEYAYGDAAGWHLTTVDSEGAVGRHTSLALDAGGYPHISYYHDWNDDVEYAYRDAAGWHVETVDSVGNVGSYTSLALDAGGTPRISYLGNSSTDLKYAYRDAANWHVETVDTVGDVGAYTSLALDAGGYPHIAYYDSLYDDLEYAHRDAAGWHLETVDSAGVVGQYTSLALDGEGYPHVSYYDNSNSQLKYAYRDAAGWHLETVDSAGDVGRYCSLALDGGGNPHISYQDSINADLKYAYGDAAGWHVETVDSAGYILYVTSLALNAGGYPHISYHDDAGDLKYAYRDTAGWHLETVDSAGFAGQYTSLALDAGGYPHVSYYHNSNSELKYAHRDAAGWHLETVDSAGVAGQYTSLALDAGGYPHVSYYELTNRDLKYAYRDTVGWHLETVDSAGDVGRYCSLALDVGGNPHISYYDLSNRDLRYLRAAALALQLDASPSSVPAGEELTYEIAYTNDLVADTTGAVLTLTLALELAFVSASPPPDGGQYAWSLGPLSQGMSGTVVVTAAVPGWIPDGTQLQTQVVLDSDQTWPNEQTIATQVSASPPDLNSLGKTVSPAGPVAAGGVLRYTLAFTNSGSGGAGNVLITDTIPAYTSYVSGSAEQGGSFAEGEVTWHLPLLKPNEMGEVSFAVRVDKPLALGTSITNTATIASDQSAPIRTNVVTNTVALLPDFGLSTKQVEPSQPPPDGLGAGDLLTYSIIYTNGGSIGASGVVVTDRVPISTTFVSACCSGAYDPDSHTVTWPIGSVGVESSGSISFTVRINEEVATGDVIRNRAWIDSSQTPPVSTNEVESLITTAVLVARKGVAPEGLVLPGTVLNYTIHYTNTGNLTATNAIVSDPLPVDVSYISGGVYDSGDHAVTFDLGTLGAGATGSGAITVQANHPLPDGTLVLNAATIQSAQTPITATNIVSNVITLPELGFNLRVSPWPAAIPGATLTYTMAYTNGAPVASPGTVITFALPAHTSYESGGVFDPGTQLVLFDLGTLGAGVSGEAQVRVQLEDPLADGSAVLASAAIGGQYAAEQSDGPVTVTVQAPSLELDKTVSSSGIIRPGVVLTYSLCYANSGSLAATNAVVTDSLPADLAYLTGGTYLPADHAVRFDLGAVEAGATGLVSVTGRVPMPLDNGTRLTNHAQMRADHAFPQTDAVTNTVTSTPAFTTSLKLVTPVGMVPLGAVLTYTIHYTNSGDMDATGVTITDPLPPGVGVLDSGSGTPIDDVLVWEIGPVAAGASGTIAYTVHVIERVAEVSNQAFIDSDQTPVAGTNQATTPIDTPVLTVVPVMSAAGMAVTGGTVTYTIPYANEGVTDATGVVMVAEVPSGTTYLAGGTLLPDEEAVRFEVGTVAAGESGEVSFTLQVDGHLLDGTLLESQATVYSDQVYPDTLQSTVPVEVVGVQDFYPLGGSGGAYYLAQSFVATAPRLAQIGTLLYGQTAPYPDLRLQLWGDAGGAPDPAAVQAVGAIITGGELTPSGVRYILAPLFPIPLTPGQRYWLVLDGTVDRGVSGSAGGRYALDNPYGDGSWKYSADGSSWTAWDGSTDLDLLVEYAEPPRTEPATITVRAPVMGMSKSADYASPFYANDPVEFTIILTNTGVVDALEVCITDTLPSVFTYQEMLAGPVPESIGGGQIVWTNPAVPAGSSLTLRFGTTANTVVGVYVNGAQATSSNAVIPDSNAVVFINLTPTPTPSPTPTNTPTNTPQTPTPTFTPPPTATPTPTNTPPNTPTNTPSPTPWPTSTPHPSRPRGYALTGIRGTYYSDRDLQTYWKTQTDSTIDFYRSGSASDDWSARWQTGSGQGTLVVPKTGTYTFYAEDVDDGVRLWVDGTLIIDQWQECDACYWQANRYLTKGNHTLKIEYFQGPCCDEGLRIKWSSSGVSKEVIHPIPLRDAIFVSQDVPRTMFAGWQYQVSLAFENAGSRIWTRTGNYQLGSQNPADTGRWGVSRVLLDPTDTIAFDQEKTFTFDVTAPDTPGTYDFQWKMIQEGVAWFGDLSTNVSINVLPSPAGSLYISHTHPVDGQDGVSTETWVSATFDRDLDPNTVNEDTVWLTDPWGYPVAGSVEYLPVSRQVVFKPDVPLIPASWAYHAAVTTDIAGTDGGHLAENHHWEFTLATEPRQVANKGIFYGDLNSHTGYSDGQGVPSDAFSAARANGLDFLAVTDHNDLLATQEWTDTLAQAEAATAPSRFIAIRGFEWSSAPEGHANVFGTGSFVQPTDPAYDELDEFYTWLADDTQSGAVAQFNHPNIPEGAFDDLALNYAADDVVQLIEVGNSEHDQSVHYPEALAAGWHVGPAHNSDTHEASWGQPSYRTGILADSLTYEDLMEGLRARRTFSTQDRNALVTLQANGAWMGSVVTDGIVDLEIYAQDPDDGDAVALLELYENGVHIASTGASTDPYTWVVGRQTEPGSRTWWYVRAVEADGDVLYTAPIWTYAAGPTAEAIYPEPDMTDVPLEIEVDFGFHPEMESGWLQPMDHDSINENTVLLSDGVSNIPGSLYYYDNQRLWGFTPDAPLRPNTVYTLTLTGDIRAGNPPCVHLRPYAWSFQTEGIPRDRLVLALEGLRDAFDHELAQNTGYAADTVHLAWDALPDTRLDDVQLVGQIEIDALQAALEEAAQHGTDPLVALEMGIGTTLATALGLEWSRDLGLAKILNATGDAYGVLIRDLMAVGGDAQAVQDRLGVQMQIPRYSGDGEHATGISQVRSQITADFDALIAGLPESLPDTAQVGHMIRDIELLTRRVYESNSSTCVYFFWPDWNSGDVRTKSVSSGLVFKDRQAFIDLYRQHADAELGVSYVDAAVTAAGTVVGIATIYAGGGALPVMLLGGMEASSLHGEAILIEQEQVMASHVVDTIGDLQLESANLWLAADDTLEYVSEIVHDPGLLDKGDGKSVTPLGVVSAQALIEDYGLNVTPPIVQAMDVPDVVLGTSGWGAGEGFLTLTNPGSSMLVVAPLIQIVHFGQERATVVHSGNVEDGDWLELMPGATEMITFTYSLLRSSAFGDPNGYDAVVRVLVADRTEGYAYLLGPHVDHFYVEPQDLLNLLGSQTADVLASGDLGPAETQVLTITTQADSKEVCIKLFQEAGSDLDLHVYDQDGHHVGLNYVTGISETQIVESTFSGSNASSEWVRITPANSGTLRIEVFAHDASLHTAFAVARFERSNLPALLDTSVSRIVRLTAEPVVTFSPQAREIGHSTPIGDLRVSITDLISGEGHSISASAVTFGSLWPILWPGNSATIAGSLDTPAGTPDGHYEGVLQVSGRDAYDLSPLSADVDVSIWFDTTPPTSTISSLPSYTSYPTIALDWRGGDATAGMATYDLQVRDGLTGTWTVWLSSTTAVSSTFSGEDGHTYFFRSRATDLVGHTEAWPLIADAQTTVDTTAPSSAVDPLPTYQATSTFTVTWSGQDATSGVAGYDIQFREGTDGIWTDWLTSTMTLAATFTGENGRTYFFRSRAVDSAGNLEAWPAQPDTNTTIRTGFQVYLPIILRRLESE